MRWLVVLALFLAIAYGVMTGPSDPQPKLQLPALGTEVVMDAPYWACAKRDDLDRIGDLVVNLKDTSAATAYGVEHCKLLPKGKRVKVWSVSATSAAVCVNEVGEATCRWTLASMLAL